jgi:iron complex transport system substrate-binding protein
LDGMSSECDGSRHLEPFVYSGGKNAINCKVISDYGMEKMSLETILLADPDVIIAMEESFATSIKSNPQWKNLRAVKSGHILTVPNVPFNYISRPPSLMRLMGIRWLIHAFYPDLIKPIDQEEKRFEKLFFPAYRG